MIILLRKKFASHSRDLKLFGTVVFSEVSNKCGLVYQLVTFFLFFILLYVIEQIKYCSLSHQYLHEYVLSP